MSELAVVIPAYNEEASISRTLDSLYNQKSKRFLSIVVNNASTDATESVLGDYQRTHPEFPLQLVNEENKGTGVACNTGFTTAIEAGATYIARTDADTVPRQDWTHNISAYFTSNPELKLLAGSTRALRDEWYRTGDNVLTPIGSVLARMIFACRWQGLGGFKAAFGHNFATSASAYQEVGGFPNTTITEADEDIVFGRTIHERFGHQAMRLAHDVVVYTSMRRIRKIGYHRTFRYYGLETNPDYRLRVCDGDIDVR